MQPTPPVFPFFRGAKLAAFATVTALMGEPIIWETATGGELVGMALFRNPTEDETLMPHARDAAGPTFTSSMPIMTYGPTQFVGLEVAVKTRGTREILRLSDGRRFLVGNIERHYDGEYFTALLSPLKPVI